MKATDLLYEAHRQIENEHKKEMIDFALFVVSQISNMKCETKEKNLIIKEVLDCLDCRHGISSDKNATLLSFFNIVNKN